MSGGEWDVWGGADWRIRATISSACIVCGEKREKDIFMVLLLFQSVSG